MLLFIPCFYDKPACISFLLKQTPLQKIITDFQKILNQKSRKLRGTNRLNRLQSLFTLQQAVQIAQPALGMVALPVGSFEDSVHFSARKTTSEERKTQPQLAVKSSLHFH